MENTQGIYIKLHGSVGLYSCHNPKCEIYRLPTNRNVFLEKNTTLMLNYIRPKCSRCGLTCEELILPPGRNKIPEEHDYHKQVYGWAEKALTNSEAWMLLGYSFPNYDKDVSNIMERALTNNSAYKNSKLKIHVISPNADNVSLRISKRLGYPVEAHNESFSSFTAKMWDLLGTQPPEYGMRLHLETV